MWLRCIYLIPITIIHIWFAWIQHRWFSITQSIFYCYFGQLDLHFYQLVFLHQLRNPLLELLFLISQHRNFVLLFLKRSAVLLKKIGLLLSFAWKSRMCFTFLSRRMYIWEISISDKTAATLAPVKFLYFLLLAWNRFNVRLSLLNFMLDYFVLFLSYINKYA